MQKKIKQPIISIEPIMSDLGGQFSITKKNNQNNQKYGQKIKFTRVMNFGVSKIGPWSHKQMGFR